MQHQSVTTVKQISYPHLKRIFKSLFQPSPHITPEDWERLESRRTPQSMRARARKEGTL